MKFRELPVNAEFIFAAEEEFSSMMPGPWIKTGPRTYTHKNSGGGKYKVGSINARVKIHPAVLQIKRNPRNPRKKTLRKVKPKMYKSKFPYRLQLLNVDGKWVTVSTHATLNEAKAEGAQFRKTFSGQLRVIKYEVNAA